jgi:outer membrane protein assembly factor BamB
LDSRRFAFAVTLTAVLIPLALPGACAKEQKPAARKPASSFLTALPNSTAVYAEDAVLRGIAPDGASSWRQVLPNGKVVTPVAAAANSMLYVRTESALHAFSPKGELLWSNDELSAPPALDPALLAPVALADSSVAVVVSAKEVRGIDTDGSLRWSVVLPIGDVAAPLVPCANGQLLVRATSGLYAISPQGKIIWHRAPSNL